MSNDANRTFIVLAAAGWIVLMAVLIFLTWSNDTEVIDRIGDFHEYLADNNDDAGKLIVTLAALVTVVLALLVIVIEVAPEEEEKELRVEQAGATTIVPASALRQRLEEALVTVPEITAARAKVSTKNKGIQAALDVTVVPNANIAAVSNEAARVVVDAVQTDLGLPVAGTPTVRIVFGEAGKTAASSVARPPEATPAPAPDSPEAEAPPVPAETVEGQPETTQAPAAWGQSVEPPGAEPEPPASPWGTPPTPEAETPPSAETQPPPGEQREP